MIDAFPREGTEIHAKIRVLGQKAERSKMMGAGKIWTWDVDIMEGCTIEKRRCVANIHHVRLALEQKAPWIRRRDSP